jgi:Na+-transporting NADH:ubiquinone oxidoreductase subunit NqrC
MFPRVRWIPACGEDDDVEIIVASILGVGLWRLINAVLGVKKADRGKKAWLTNNSWRSSFELGD